MLTTRLVLVAGLAAALAVACASTSAGAARAASFGASAESPLVHAAPVIEPPSLAHLLVAEDEDDDESGSVIGTLIWYIPNRVLDVLDIVRARVRLGPGVAFGARATELADVFLGTYATIYVGLPGPRGRVFPRLPAGFESKSGAEASVADVTVEGGIGPDYGEFECGAGLQLLIVGFDVGVDPFEILDLAVGLLTFDPASDDF